MAGVAENSEKIYIRINKQIKIMDIRIGQGYDVHALGDGLRLVLGGVEIAHTKGCIAHSDGDVAIHAI